MKGLSHTAYKTQLVLAAACWGVATVMSKGVLDHIPPLTLLVLQLAVSVTFLWVVVAVQRWPVRLSRAALRPAMTGLLNPGLAHTFSLLGLTLTTASMVSLIWAAEPVLILGLAWLLLRERLTRPLIACSILAIVGVVLVAGIDTRLTSGAVFLGNLLTILGVLCCALYSVITRRIVARLDPIVLVALQQTVALGWALLIWPIEWWRGEFADLTAVSSSVWALAVASGVVYYGLAYYFYLTALAKIPVSVASQFFNLIPVFGVGGAYVFLGERLSLAHWIGGGLIISAVIGILGQYAPEPAATVAHDTQPGMIIAEPDG